MGQSNLVSVEEDPLRMSTNVFGLEQLFYMPLKAVIDANNQAALAAIDIIREYGFDNDKNSENYGQLKMVTFSYNYVGKSGIMETMSISIPFITLIPLPLLEVKQAELDFALKVLGQIDIDVNSQLTTNNDKNSLSQGLMAMFAPDKTNNVMNLSLEANMNVNIKVGQSDLPGGIIQLLNLGQEATMGDNLFELYGEPESLLFGFQTELSLKVAYKVREDLPKDIIFNVTVEPSPGYETLSSPPFSEPITILKGNLYGKSTWKFVQVIPIIEKGFATFELQFSAGQQDCNGFIFINSNYSKQLKTYFSIN